MFKQRKGGGVNILLLLIFLIYPLKARVTDFRIFLLSERYFVSGNFENSITKPFYKDYENSLNFFFSGFIYHRDFLRYELKNYFVWQGWNGNLKKRQEKNFLKSPFSLNLSFFPRSKFPFRFFVKKEDFQKINNITFERKTLTYSVSQSFIINKFPNFNFVYSWGKDNGRNKKAFSIKSNYSINNHSFYSIYRRDFPAIYPYSENYRFGYNYNIPGKIRTSLNINYFFRNGYTYTNSNFNFEKKSVKDYIFNFFYYFNKSKISTSNNFKLSYRKFMSERVTSQSSASFSFNSLTQGKNYTENIFQGFSFKFLNFPKSLTLSPGFSLFFTQNFRGSGWGYMLSEGNLFEHRKFLFFKTFRFFINFYLKGINDKWIYKNETRKGYNTGILSTYESEKYFISFNIYLNQDITKIEDSKSTWTRYFTSIELRTKKVPFYLSYNKEYIITNLGTRINREFLNILFRAPVRFMNLFAIDERLYFRNKFENNLKIIFARDYRGLILNISLEYIYLIYPGGEHNLIFHFYIKRKLKII